MQEKASIPVTARLADLATIARDVVPQFITPTPTLDTLRNWFDAAQISSFKRNPSARRGGGVKFYSVAGVEKYFPGQNPLAPPERIHPAMTRDLPQFRDMLASPPQAGEGVHAWLYRISRQMHQHMTVNEIVGVLKSQVAGCGRVVSEREILDAVTASIATAWRPGGNSTPGITTPKWPAVNERLRASIIRESGNGLADAWEASPIRLDSSDNRCEWIIDRLFPGNPLLCAGLSMSDFDTKPRESWAGELSGLQLVCPSPMSGITGLTKDGRESKHSLNNTGPRRFLVCEFDRGTVDEQSALLLHLATKAPLIVALHSGGKSLHGWFYVAGVADERLKRFFNYAVTLGADSRMWTRSQFARIPDGTRDNGARQTVYFLNFRPLHK